MKISKLDVHIVSVPPPHLGGMYWIFVSLKTECGLEGVGEVYSASFHPSVMKRAIEDVFDRYLKDHDPHHVERFFRECYSSGFTQRTDLSMRSEEHTSELQSRRNLVCRLLLEKTIFYQ